MLQGENHIGPAPQEAVQTKRNQTPMRHTLAKDTLCMEVQLHGRVVVGVRASPNCFTVSMLPFHMYSFCVTNTLAEVSAIR